MKRKSLAFFRCAMRSRSTGILWWYYKGDVYFHAYRYLRVHQNIPGLKPYK